MIRVGLIGVGRWGRHVARDLVSLDCEVTAVCRSQAAAERAREAGVSDVIPSLDGLAGVAGVVVCTTSSTHADVIESIAGLGVPVFVEKPMTDDSARARELVELLGERLFVMDKWRYHGGVSKIAELARSGRLGEIQGLRTRRVANSNPHDDVDATWMLLPHELAIATEVFGAPLQPLAVIAATSAGGEVVHMHALMGEHSGARPWHSVEISASTERREREISVVCDDGVVSMVDPYADHVLLREHGAENAERVKVDTIEMPLLLELRMFVEHLHGGPPPLSPAIEGLRSVELIERMRQMAGIADS